MASRPSTAQPPIELPHGMTYEEAAEEQSEAAINGIVISLEQAAELRHQFGPGAGRRLGHTAA